MKGIRFSFSRVDPLRRWRLFRFAIAFALVAFVHQLALADPPANQATTAPAEIAWGADVGGLRVGIACAELNPTADQQPRFRVVLENRSDQPIVVPATESYVTREREGVAHYRAQPLTATIQCVEGPEATYSVSGGDKLNAIAEIGLFVAIAAHESRTIADVPLDDRGFAVGRDDYDGRAALQRWWLLPGGTYRVRFAFINEKDDEAQKRKGKSWKGRVSSGPLTIHVSPTPFDRTTLAGEFTLSKEEYFVGEPIRAKFSVTNQGDRTIAFPTGGDYRGSGRHDRFAIRAVGQDGNTVPDPVDISKLGPGGGLGGDTQLKPGETYAETLLVNQWCTFAAPGRYTIEAKRVLNLPPMDDRDGRRVSSYAPEAVWPAVPIESKLTVVIKRDDAALAERVKALAVRVDVGKVSSETVEELRMLADLQVEAALSPIIALVSRPKLQQSYAITWLAQYPRDQATAALVAIARVDGAGGDVSGNLYVPRTLAIKQLAEWNAEEAIPLLLEDMDSRLAHVRAEAVLACFQTPFPECFDRLLRMAAEDPDPKVQRYLGAALAAYKDERAILPLLRLLNDTNSRDPYIQIWAAEGLGKLGRQDGVPVLINLLRDSRNAPSRANLTATLSDLTGQDLPRDAEPWIRWWEEKGRHAGTTLPASSQPSTRAGDH